MDLIPLEVQGKSDGAWYPVDSTASGVVSLDGERVLKVRKSGCKDGVEEVVYKDEMYQRLRYASRVAKTADAGLLLEGLFVVGLAEMPNGDRKWYDCEIMRRTPNQGPHELRVKWDIGTKQKDNEPVNHVLNLAGLQCVRMKSNRDISLHPKFREWMAQVKHLHVNPTLVDLTSPPMRDLPDPSSSNPVIQIHNMGLRAGSTIRIPVQRNRHIGQIVQPTNASITRFPQFLPVRRQEVVNLVDEEDARELGMRGRNNNRYPLQFDQRMIRDNTGLQLQPPVIHVDMADMTQQASQKMNNFRSKQPFYMPFVGGALPNGGDALLARETLDFEDMHATKRCASFGGQVHKDRIDLTCEEERIHEPVRFALPSRPIYVPPTCIAPYALPAYPRSIELSSHGRAHHPHQHELAANLCHDTSLLQVPPSPVQGQWIKASTLQSHPRVNDAGSSLSQSFPGPVHKHSQSIGQDSKIAHLDAKTSMPIWGSSFPARKVPGNQNSSDLETKGATSGNFSETSKLGLLYLATCCFEDDDCPKYLKEVQSLRVESKEGMKRQKISWGDI